MKTLPQIKSALAASGHNLSSLAPGERAALVADGKAMANNLVIAFEINELKYVIRLRGKWQSSHNSWEEAEAARQS